MNHAAVYFTVLASISCSERCTPFQLKCCCINMCLLSLRRRRVFVDFARKRVVAAAVFVGASACPAPEIGWLSFCSALSICRTTVRLTWLPSFRPPSIRRLVGLSIHSSLMGLMWLIWLILAPFGSFCSFWLVWPFFFSSMNVGGTRSSSTCLGPTSSA